MIKFDPRMVQLTDSYTSTPCYVRADHILAIVWRQQDKTELMLTSRMAVHVKESPNEVCTLCLVQDYSIKQPPESAR